MTIGCIDVTRSVFYLTVQKDMTIREYIETFQNPEDVPLYLFRCAKCFGKSLRSVVCPLSNTAAVIVVVSSDFADEHKTIYEESREIIEFMDKVPGIQGLRQGQFFIGPAGTGVLLPTKRLWTHFLLKSFTKLCDARCTCSLAFFSGQLTVLRSKTLGRH